MCIRDSIGAGTGSVTLEWLRCHELNQAIAFERDAQRAVHIKSTAEQLGVATHLTIITGDALEHIATCTPPDAIFIGGGIENMPLATHLWKPLRKHGRLVAHAVTLESQNQLLHWYQQYGGTLREINVRTISTLGQHHALTATRPIWQWAVRKQ